MDDSCGSIMVNKPSQNHRISSFVGSTIMMFHVCYHFQVDGDDVCFTYVDIIGDLCITQAKMEATGPMAIKNNP